MVGLCTLWLKFACGQVSSPRLCRLKKVFHFKQIFKFAAITMGYFSATSLIHNASKYLNIVEIFVAFETETKIISLMASAILVVTAVLSYPASVTRDTRWILLVSLSNLKL